MRVACLAGIDTPLPPRLLDALAGAERILVAGGIADPRALDELGRLAPVVAVVGTRDFVALGDRFPETVELELAGARVLVTHLVGSTLDPLPPVRERLDTSPPDVVVHGQAGRPDVEWRLGTLFFCPGASHPPRRGLPATCGVLEIDGPGRITAHIFDL